jgi:hypothetical protein
MKSEPFGERAPLKDAYAQLGFFFRTLFTPVFASTPGDWLVGCAK